MKRCILLVLVGLACTAASASATPLIDTITAWDGSSFISPFGEPNTATYGQTFTVTGPETVLNRSTFLLDGRDDPGTVAFDAYVYAWDPVGFRPTGPALFSTGPLATTPNSGFEAFPIDTGSLALTAGNQYVAFFSASDRFDGTQGLANWGASQFANPYADGAFVFINNGAVFAGIFGSSWDTCNIPNSCFVGTNGNLDLAFKAEFSVPEPGSLALLGLGLAGLAVARVRRVS